MTFDALVSEAKKSGPAGPSRVLSGFINLHELTIQDGVMTSQRE